MIFFQMKNFFVLFLTFWLLCTCHEQRAANHNPSHHGNNLSMSSRPEIFIFILIIMAVTFIIQHHCEIWEGIKKVGDYIEQKYKNYCVVKKVDVQKESIDYLNCSLNNLDNQSKVIQRNNQIVVSNFQNNQEMLILTDQKEKLEKACDDRDLASSQKNDSFKECNNVARKVIKALKEKRVKSTFNGLTSLSITQSYTTEGNEQQQSISSSTDQVTTTKVEVPVQSKQEEVKQQQSESETVKKKEEHMVIVSNKN